HQEDVVVTDVCISCAIVDDVHPANLRHLPGDCRMELDLHDDHSPLFGRPSSIRISKSRYWAAFFKSSRADPFKPARHRYLKALPCWKFMCFATSMHSMGCPHSEHFAGDEL